MSRFYVRPEDVKGSEILVSREEAHHILNVMRLSEGDEIVAFDGTGSEYIGRIMKAAKSGLKIRVDMVNKPNIKNRIPVTLCQSLPKRAKMDFIVEKATELGVGTIIPMVTERTISRPGDKGDRKRAHWQNIAVNAAKQCGRLDVPEVKEVICFNDAIKRLGEFDKVLMACLPSGQAGHYEGTEHIKNSVLNFRGRVLVMVGPEGDFTPKEIEAARAAGAKLVSLGRLVLRVDTAALYILSVLNYESGI
jgi:16S rRNA (uracil1498-N3)-methyltransferase